MAKSRGRKFAELVAPSNGIFDAASLPTIPAGKLPTISISKLANSTFSVNSESASLGGNITLDTGDITEHTSAKYFTDTRADARITAHNLLARSGGTMTGNLTLGDNVNAYFGASTDLRIYHDGTNSHIINSTGELRFTGSNLAFKSDSAKLYFGASDDLQIYHDGSHSYMANTGGSLYIRSANSIQLETNGGVDMLTLGVGGAATLFHNGSAKLATGATGVTVTGVIAPTSHLQMNHADNQYIYLGAGNDLQIYHNGSHSYIDEAGTGNLYIRNGTKNSIFMRTDGEVILYHNNSGKLATTSTGVQTTGTLNVNGAYSFPTSDGTSGQVLQTDGSGNLTFVTGGGGAGDITAVVAGTNLTGGATSGSATVNLATNLSGLGTISSGPITVTTGANQALLVTGGPSSLHQKIYNTGTTGTYSYLQLTTVNSGSTQNSGYLIKNAAQNTGNSLGNNSLYLWNQTNEVELVPAGTIANRFTVETNGNVTIRGSAATIGGNTVWHAGNDGANSGLYSEYNKSLVGAGGINNAVGTDIVEYSGQISASVTGLFNASNNANGILRLNTHPGNYYHDLGFSSDGNMYHRNFTNSNAFTTAAWYKVWDASNDGSGSGLDADTLDGVQLANIARTDLHETFTSNITVNGNIYTGDGNDGYFYNDSAGRTAFAGGDFYIQSSVGNYYNYATNQYIGDSSGDNIYFRGNVLSGTGWQINGSGALTTRDHQISAGYQLTRGDHHTGYLEGSYNNVGANSAKSNPIYSIGSGYVPADAGFGNMYGIGYSHSNFWGTGSGKPTDWGLYACQNGSPFFITTNTGTWSSGQFNRNGNTVWDAGNDGSGSGLDADTLDSVQGSTIQQGLARINGWEPAYGGSAESNVYYDYGERAVVIDGANDSNIGAAFKAVRVEAGEELRFTVQIKGSAANSNGMYIRLYAHNGEMPNGKTHVSNDASTSSAFVQEDDAGVTSWHENGSVSTSYVSYTRTYTAAQTQFVSLVILNWTAYGSGKLYVRQPDIAILKVNDSHALDGTTGGNYMKSGAGDSVTGWWISSARNGNSGSPQVYFSHSSGYGQHINTYNTSGSIYALQVHNNSKELFGVYNDGTVKANGGHLVVDASSTYTRKAGGMQLGSTSSLSNASGTLALAATSPYISFHHGSGARTGYIQEASNRLYFGEFTYTEDPSSFRSPIFYDSNDTNYYADIAGTSRFNYIRPTDISCVGNVDYGAPRWDFRAHVVESPHHYATSNTETMYIGEDNTINLRDHAICEDDCRAPIFYHSSNTTYYVRPGSSSKFNGDIFIDGNYGIGIVGVYSATRYQHVWMMGSAYRTNAAGTSYGNAYGLTWTHTNIGTGTNQSISGLSHQLQVRANGTLWSAIGNGIWTNGNVTAYSDIAVKTNLEIIPNALEKVCSLHGYTYERTDYVKDPEDPNAPDKLVQAGVVAQEVEKVLPEVVSGEEGNKSVAYGNMVSILIEAIKELKTEVDELKAQLNKEK